MRSNDWQRVEELFHAALELGGAERDDYLARECRTDEALRRDVESLVGAFEAERGFIEQPAFSLGLRVLSGGPPGSLAGRTVGHYKVVRLLGSGGMGGEVYLSEDCQLERPVALKFIARDYVGDEWAKEQVMKEAKAVARLEHPNICAVHGVGEADGHNFIVMQYIEGETLASLLRCGRPGHARALSFAQQIASALAAAHARGVIHRDLKPENIIVTVDGQVKVLDFGLAKLVRQRMGAEGAADPGQTLQMGAVVGTPAYMSPEQTRGEELDGRSDIFSLGVILYEMLDGENPFLRETIEETITAIRSDDPPSLAASRKDVPKRLESIIRRCLAKEQEGRAESADFLLRELHSLRHPAQSHLPHLLARVVPARRHLARYAAAALALVCLLLAAAGLAYLKLSRVHTLAVLPIVNKSGDTDADYLSEGLTHDLFDKFSYLPRLRIKLPSVVPPDKTEKADLADIGRELEADAVLSGEIFKQDGALRLHVSLLNAADTTQIWDNTFDVDPAHIFALQDDVTRGVASGLGLWLVGDDKKLLNKRQTDNQDALKLYMQGRSYWSLRRSRDDVRKAISLFEQATQIDPSFAKAYSGLAECYALSTNVAYGPMTTEEAVSKARYNAREAIEAGDELPESHASMGIVKLRYDWDWQRAEQEFGRAIGLDPDYAPAHYWYTNLLALLRRPDEAIRQSEVARSLDPYSPLYAMNYGRALYYARRYDEAAGYFRRMSEENSDYPQFRHMLGLVLLQQGRYEEAVTTLEKVHATNKEHTAAALGYAYGKAGRYDDAARMLRELDQLSTPQDPISPHEWALIYIGMGDRDKAFSMLEAAYKDKFAGLIYLTTDPMYDDLRADPRFAELARRINLVP